MPLVFPVGNLLVAVWHVVIPKPKNQLSKSCSQFTCTNNGPPLVGALSAPMDVSAGVVVAWYGCSWAGHWVVRPPGTLVGFRWSFHHREWLGGWFWEVLVILVLQSGRGRTDKPVSCMKNQEWLWLYIYMIYRFVYTSCKHYAANRRCCSKSGWWSSNYSFCIVLVMIVSDSCSCYNSRHSMYQTL